MKNELQKWIEELPKIELHIHLEGSIPLDTLWELIKKYDQGKSVQSKERIEKRYKFKNFAHFIETWNWKSGYIREYDDFTLLADGVAGYLTGQKVLYSEMFFSPPEFRVLGLNIGKITEAVKKGFSRHPEVKIELICDLVRQFGPEESLKTLDELREIKNLGIIGIGLGGLEKEFPPALFRKTFEKARAEGFHVTAHAGEAAGEESIRDAVNLLKAERIGHGTCLKDPGLINSLKEKRIGVEMCPLSNLLTGSIPSLEEHPIRKLFNGGLLVSLNSDDPAMFSNPLNREFLTAALTYNFTREELKKLVLNAVDSSWAADKLKGELRSRIASVKS